MNPTLTKLLDDKKYDEARRLIAMVAAKELSPDEKDETLLATISSDLETQIKSNTEYSKNLEIYISALQDINKKEAELEALDAEALQKIESLRTAKPVI